MDLTLDSVVRSRGPHDRPGSPLRAAIATSGVVLATLAGAIVAWTAIPTGGAAGAPAPTIPRQSAPPGTKLSSRGMAMLPCSTRWRFETDHWVCARGPR
jgi:hypothetical protein